MAHKKNKSSSKLTSEQRRKAVTDLSLSFLSSYYANWRLTKVLTIQKLLSDRYTFFNDILTEVKQWDDEDGKATIAQEIKSGLYFDAIAHCVQYIEDLFALIKAAEKPEYFIRNIITYNAGNVTNFIKSFTPTKKNISETFHFPYRQHFINEAHKQTYDKSVDHLFELVTDLVKFYKDHAFFYNQYKHGLAVAMRPFGNKYNEEQVNKDINNELAPHLAVYDNWNLNAASKNGTYNGAHGAILPGFSENVASILSQLHDENNFLRLAYPPDYPATLLSIELLVDKARKTRTCIHTFIGNYAKEIQPSEKLIEFQLPEDYTNNIFCLISIDRKQKEPYDKEQK